jgi:acyl-CoA hydrolase
MTEIQCNVSVKHTNMCGYLMGGQLLAWADQFASTEALREHPGCRFVTKSFDNAVFNTQVWGKTDLRFQICKTRTGVTSVTYLVNVFLRNKIIFDTSITYMNVDINGNKKKIQDEEESV